MGGRACLIVGFVLFIGVSILPKPPATGKLADRLTEQPSPPPASDEFSVVHIAEWVIPVRPSSVR